MQQLPNNCRAGKFSVSPANWNTRHADPKTEWRIIYWFYDDNMKQKKQVPIKGMNHIKNLKEKQSVIKAVIKDELIELKNGYNPINKSYNNEPASEIDEATGLLDALQYAFKNIELSHKTRIDIKSSLRFITVSMKELHYERLPLGMVRRRHIRLILEGCGKIKTYTDIKGNKKIKRWSPNQFNRYRTDLSMLFSEIVESEAIDVNPVREIKKKPQLKKIRETMTYEQRQKLKEYTKKYFYTFYRFLEIFFHSSSRITELLNLKKEDVNINDQRFKIVVKKGRKYEEVYRTIKTIVLPFWIEIYNEALPGQYLFGKGLKPEFRDKPIRPEQITRRFRRHAKKKLGITADIYSLKHSNLDEISKYFGEHKGTKVGIKEAQQAAGHSTPVITMRYLPGQDERNHIELKEVANEF